MFSSYHLSSFIVSSSRGKTSAPLSYFLRRDVVFAQAPCQFWFSNLLQYPDVKDEEEGDKEKEQGEETEGNAQAEELEEDACEHGVTGESIGTRVSRTRKK
ncbi:MAG: hypothetical protein WGN25_01965 [Candidatus Electrothrix sp. GW3-4]|uniref:hypothetical protein n=1 Tax=Candidatus Electrothrix sp. GW3-4 TaxID=3126740 RepID=UPI0030CCCF3E